MKGNIKFFLGLFLWASLLIWLPLSAGQTRAEPDRGNENGLVSMSSPAVQTEPGFPLELIWRLGPAISADGRLIAFSSPADSLVEGDTNDGQDVFLFQEQTGQIERISLAGGGTQAQAGSQRPSISADGRYIVFDSSATDLFAADANTSCDQNGYPSASQAAINLNCDDVFVLDRQLGELDLVSITADGLQGNGASGSAAISADGRYIAFWSKADNLVEGDTNETDDVFIRDMQTGQIVRVSVASDGSQGNGLAQRSFTAWAGPPAISADGRYVAFWHDADNLINDDTNETDDVYLHDTLTGQTSRVSIASDGSQGEGYSGWPAISADGRYIAFVSVADNLVDDDTNDTWDIFVHDQQTGQTRRVSVASDTSEANGQSAVPAISADGRYVVFSSEASTLLASDTVVSDTVASDTNEAWDIFVHDSQTGQTDLLSIGLDAAAGDSASFSPAISADGNHVVFWSNASNLVEDDTNDEADLYVADIGGDIGGEPAQRSETEPSTASLPPATATAPLLPAPVPTPSPVATAQPTTYKLAYTKWDGGKHNLYIANTNGTGEQFILDSVAGPSWSVDGTTIFLYGEPGVNFQNRDIYPDIASCELAGISDGLMAITVPPAPLDICQAAGEVYQGPGWNDGTARWANAAPDGSLVAYDAKPGGNYRIYFLSLADDQNAGFEIIGEQGDWSPDSQRLVYRSSRDGRSGLWISNRDDTGHTQITSGGSDAFPAWSPDGETIAFSREEGGNVDIYLINPDGTNVRRLTTALGHDSLPAYTPGGELIFRSSRTGSWGIWRMNGDGSNQQEIIADARVGPDWIYSRMDVAP